MAVSTSNTYKNSTPQTQNGKSWISLGVPGVALSVTVSPKAEGSLQWVSQKGNWDRVLEVSFLRSMAWGFLPEGLT